MIPSPSLPWFELARFRRSRLTRAAIVAVLMVPLFYGALYVWANIDPTHRLDRVKAAVVNEDQLVEVTGTDGKKQPVAVGRQLAANLVRDDSDQNYDWELTDARDAQQGLADGEYKAVLTLPKNLSKAATSTSGDPADAVQGKLDLQTNDAVNYVNGQIATRILDAAKSALNAQVTETYLDNVYLSFSDIKTSLAEAGQGAGRLADGAAKLQDGAGQLGSGARTLADGAGRLDSGADQLAGGLGRLEKGTSQLPSATRQLARGSRQVSTGVSSLNRVVQTVTSAILAATDGPDQAVQQVKDAVKAAADACHATQGADCTAIDRAVQQTQQLDGIVGDLRRQARQASAQANALDAGAKKVAAGNAELARKAPQLASGVSDASRGADQLAAGTGQLSSGADRLADGATGLEDGADQLAAGLLKLEGGLTEGAGKVPDYDKDERDQLASTVATPLKDAAGRVNPVSSYGEGLAPYFISLALWVGAMAVYLLLRPFSARAVASTRASARVALAGLAPGVALSAVQAVLLVAVLGLVVGVDAASWPRVLGFALLTGVVFTAINQMCIALLGPAGRFVAIVLVCLQLTSAGGTYPIETAPGFFGFLHPLLPMSYAVHGLRGALAGSTEGMGQDVFALVLFLLGAIAVTVIAVRRRQSVRMQQLHPTLVV
ncbi:MAG: YhgE/Pip domain-containing protein [Aeromicrobium erythreum]